jgi:hypothetical protein
MGCLNLFVFPFLNLKKRYEGISRQDDYKIGDISKRNRCACQDRVTKLRGKKMEGVRTGISSWRWIR